MFLFFVMMVAALCGTTLGAGLASARFHAALNSSSRRVADRTALFLMEVKGAAAHAAALEAAERERRRSDPIAEAFWRDTAERVLALEGPQSDGR
jgi:hypothetical protein